MFACVFVTILERFGQGFGKGLGEVLEVLGVSWGTFKPLFSRLFCQEGPRESKRQPRGLLGSIWDGFGKVLGKVWHAKIVKIEIFGVFLDMLFGILILVDCVRFLIISMGGMVNQNQLRAFAKVKRTEKHLIFVSGRDRVFSVKPNAGKAETKTKYNKVNAKHLKFS